MSLLTMLNVSPGKPTSFHIVFPTIDRTVNNIAVQSFVAVYGFPAFEEAQGVIIRVGLFHGYRIACRKVEDNDVVAFYRAEL